MRIFSAAIIIASAAFLGLPAVAAGQTSATGPDASQNRSAGERERVVCRSVVRSGTRMRRGRDCRTAAEWEQARADEVGRAAETLDVIGEKVSTNDTGGMGPRH